MPATSQLPSLVPREEAGRRAVRSRRGHAPRDARARSETGGPIGGSGGVADLFKEPPPMVGLTWGPRLSDATCAGDDVDVRDLVETCHLDDLLDLTVNAMKDDARVGGVGCGDDGLDTR